MCSPLMLLAKSQRKRALKPSSPIGWRQFCQNQRGHTQQRLEHEHLKMKDQRSGKGTNQWTLLLGLATTGGSLSWQDSDADYKWKKQKQELANKLKQSFGLSEDPLPWSRKENCYKARFIIRADDNVLRQLTVDNDRHRLLRTRQLPSS